MRIPECGCRGFTLLEVLAAVSILGILYVVLADVAMQGLLSEGRSRRRLEASLLADERLSDIEIEMASGNAPELGRSEDEDEDFVVVVDVQPFEVTLPEDEPEPGVPPPAALPVSEGMASLREIVVSVTWLEGEDEQRVWRTSYGYDAAAFAAAVPEETGEDEAGSAAEPTLEEFEAQIRGEGG